MSSRKPLQTELEATHMQLTINAAQSNAKRNTEKNSRKN